MEQVKAPENIFLHPDIGGREFIRPWLKIRVNQESVEYTRTDAFIEKAKEFLSKESNIPLWEDRGGNFGCDTTKLIEDFVNYMKGE